MPEYPEIVVTIEKLIRLARGQRLRRIRIAHPFVLRTADPPISSLEGLTLNDVERIQKQIVFVFPDDLFLVLHLMISGRLSWHENGCKIPRRRGLAALDFESGSLLLTEPSTKKRASLHLVKGLDHLESFDRDGLDVLAATPETFADRIRSQNHTLKRALTDQRILDGIGNAYSDEILHRAGLSPFLRTEQVDDEQVERLYDAIRETLADWTDRVREAAGRGLPRETTRLRKRMSVHGKYGEPCPACGSHIQRVRYASRETNYCPRCQTGGRVLADRVLSRLLKDDWPDTIEELEQRTGLETSP